MVFVDRKGISPTGKEPVADCNGRHSTVNPGHNPSQFTYETPRAFLSLSLAVCLQDALTGHRDWLGRLLALVL